jgi:hypothetical protein
MIGPLVVSWVSRFGRTPELPVPQLTHWATTRASRAIS